MPLASYLLRGEAVKNNSKFYDYRLCREGEMQSFHSMRSCGYSYQ
jgi:hypothetical protein